MGFKKGRKRKHLQSGFENRRLTAVAYLVSHIPTPQRERQSWWYSLWKFHVRTISGLLNITTELQLHSNYLCPWTLGEQHNLGHKLRCHGKDVKIFSGKEQMQDLPVVCLSLSSLDGSHTPALHPWAGSTQKPAGLIRNNFLSIASRYTFDPSPVPFQILFSKAAGTKLLVCGSHAHSSGFWSQNVNVSGQKITSWAFVGSFRTVVQRGPQGHHLSCPQHPVWLGPSQPPQTNCTHMELACIFVAQASWECKPHWPRKVGEIASERRKEQKRNMGKAGGKNMNTVCLTLNVLSQTCASGLPFGWD